MAGPGVPANSPLLNPNATLSGKPLYQAAVNLADAQYNPAISGLQSQANQNNTQATNAENLTGQYFNQLGQYVNQSNQQLGQIGTNLNDQLAASAANEQNQLRGIASDATNSLLAYAPQAYGNNSLAQPALASLQTELAKQQGLAAQMGSNWQNFGATQGANYSSLGASNLGSFSLRGQEDLNQIAQAGQVRNEPIMSKIAALQQSRGALIGTDLGKLRQQEIANQISRAGLGLKQATLNNTITNDQATQKNNAAKVAATIRGQNVAAQTSTANNQRTTAASIGNNQRTNATSRANNAANNAIKQEELNPNQVGTPAWARAQKARAATTGGQAKPLPTGQNNTFWGKMGTIEQLIKDGQAKGGNMAQIQDGLTTGANPAKEKFDTFMVQVAVSLLQSNGYITPQQAAQLHNMYGVRGGTYNGQNIRVQSQAGVNTVQAVQNAVKAGGL